MLGKFKCVDLDVWVGKTLTDGSVVGGSELEVFVSVKYFN